MCKFLKTKYIYPHGYNVQAISREQFVTFFFIFATTMSVNTDKENTQYEINKEILTKPHKFSNEYNTLQNQASCIA